MSAPSYPHSLCAALGIVKASNACHVSGVVCSSITRSETGLKCKRFPLVLFNLALRSHLRVPCVEQLRNVELHAVPRHFIPYSLTVCFPHRLSTTADVEAG